MFSNRDQRYLIKAALVLFLLGLIGLTACAPHAPQITKFDPEKGSVGTEVTIEGKRFKDSPAENTVKFSGVSVPTADILSASNQAITAKVPRGAETGRISVTTSNGTGRSKKDFTVESLPVKWTLMVYLDADNNLEYYGIDDFLEMASVGSTSQINIVVQMDRPEGGSESYGGWTGTRRFLIERDDDPSVTPVQDLGEQNMGDPAVLQDFVEWAVTKYRADHYALIIWGEGRGEPDVGAMMPIVVDESDGDDTLYMHEVQEALEAVNVKPDIVGFDASLMGMIEVAYALRNVTSYMVGSENQGFSDGWPYDTILGDLVKTPSSSPEDLAKLIVTEYVDSYPKNPGVTLSAVNIAELDTLVSRINAFTRKATTEWDTLKSARTKTQQYHPSTCPEQSCWGVDLWDFADKVQNQVTSTDIKTAANKLKDAIEDFVVSEGHGANMVGSHGIAIYFPPTQTDFDNDPDHTGYEESDTLVDFVREHRWDNWLKNKYYPNIP